MTGYNVSLQGNIAGFKKVSSAITQYNALSVSGTKEQNTFANAVSVTNGKLGTYLTGLNGAKASLGGYVISLVGATVKTVALKVATIALNSAVTMGASLIVSGIVSAISEWINKTENMIEASEEALEKIKSINDELKNNQKTISDVAKRYAELAQGVDQLTGKNISLSNEDYEEFLSLSNQLAEMFPTLTRNYNDNGDAIVQLSGDVDTIVGSLQNLIEAQRDLANRQIVDELPTVFDGIVAKSNRYKSELEDLEDKKNALLQGLGDFTSEGLSQKVQTGLAEKYFEVASNDIEEYCRLVDDYTKLLEETNLEYSINNFDPIWNGEYDNDGNQILTYKTSIYIESSDEDVEKAKNTIDGKIQELASQYETDINKLNEEINTTNEKNKANWTSLSSSIFAWLSTDDSFKVMDDTMQATVQNIVNSLDWGSLDFSSWEEAKQYIQENILSLFNTSEGKETLKDIEVMFGIQTQFNNGDISVEQYQQKLQDFLNSIENLPPETKKSILLLFGIQTNDDGTTTSDVDTMVENVKKKLKGTEFDDKVRELSLGDLKIAADYLEVGDDTIQSWDELITKIEEYKESQKDNETNIPSYDTLSESAESASKSVNTLRSSISSVNDSFAEQAENGSISVDTMLSLVDAGYATALQFDEVTGACTINKEAMLDLVKAKIQNQIADLQTLQTDIASKLKDDGIIASESADGFIKLAKSKAAAATAEQLSSVDNYNAAEAQIKALENAIANLDKIGSGSYSTKFKSSTKSAAEEAEKATKEYIESYLEFQKQSLETGRIDYKTYCRDVVNYLNDMYSKGKMSLKEYHDYAKQMFEVRKSVLDSVVSAVTKRFDKEIESLNEEKELIESNYNAKIDAIQSEIDALEEANEKRKDQIDLEKKQYELEKARQQKVNALYTADKGKIFTTDSSAIRDAQDEIIQKQHDMKISQLKSQIESLQDAMETETKAIDDQIKALNRYKEQWSSVADQYEDNQREMYAAGILGNNWQQEVLNGNLQILNNFANEYFNIQRKIQEEAWASANAQIEAANAVANRTDYTPKKPKDDPDENPDEEILKNKYASNAFGAGKWVRQKYASGTTNAKKGLNLVGEDGIETFIDNDGNISLVTEPTLIPMEGGEIVKNESETKSLLDGSNLVPLQTSDLFKKLSVNMPDLSSMINVNVPDYSKISGMFSKAQTIEQHNQFNVTLPNITDSTKATKLFEELQRLPLDALQYANIRKK